MSTNINTRRNSKNSRTNNKLGIKKKKRKPLLEYPIVSSGGGGSGGGGGEDRDGSFKLNVREFDMRSIKPCAKILLVGRSGVGKTTIVKDICRQLKDVPIGICMTGTEDGVEEYSKIIPPLNVYSEYDPMAVRKLVAVQKLKNKGIPQGSPHRKRAFILFDDLHYDTKMLKDEVLDYIFFNSRHNEMDFIATAQDPGGFKPRLRTNLNYIFILNDPNIQNREKIFKYFAGQLGGLKYLNQVMDAFTKNYSCLVIDNTSLTNNLEDSIFWYKSPNLPCDFKMCSKQAWEFSNKHYKYIDEYATIPQKFMNNSLNENESKSKKSKKGKTKTKTKTKTKKK